MARAGGELGEQGTIIPLRPLPGIPFGRGMRLVGSDGQRAVVAGSAVLHVWDAADKVAERIVIISLLRAKQTTQVELGPLLGYHRSTIGRLIDRVEQDGTAGLIQSKPGPKGPHKVTPEVMAVLDEGAAAGLGCVRLGRLVEERTGVSLSTGHVCRLMAQRSDAQVQAAGNKIAEQIEFDVEPPGEVVEASDTRLDDVDASVVLPECSRGSRMGAALCYPALEALGLLEAAGRCFRLPDFVTYFVGDQRGRPLLFVAEQAGRSLVQTMPRIVAEIRRAVGDRRFVVVFDRGGHDSKLFEWLTGEDVDFITYQIGEPKLPRERFGRRRARFGGRRVWLRIAEDTVCIAGSGPWRRIVVLRPDGYQLPILTSLGPGVPAALIACSMLARWRQENFFRYMRQRMSLDQLVSYSFEEADGEQLVPNPRRGKLDDLLKELRRHLADIHAELGLAVRLGDHDSREALWTEAREFEAEIEELVARRKSVPKHVTLASLGGRKEPRLEQKAIVDRIKLTAYNAEEWLLERLLVHYPHAHDARALLRSFFELPGEMRANHRCVQVVIDPPDNPLHRRAMRGLCADLNQLAVRYPGTDLPVTYAVEMHHSEAAA